MPKNKTYKVNLNKESLRLRGELMKYRGSSGSFYSYVDIAELDRIVQSRLREAAGVLMKKFHESVIHGIETVEVRIPLDISQ